MNPFSVEQMEVPSLRVRVRMHSREGTTLDTDYLNIAPSHPTTDRLDVITHSVKPSGWYRYEIYTFQGSEALDKVRCYQRLVRKGEYPIAFISVNRAASCIYQNMITRINVSW